jgi:hypothetical protein
MEPTKSYRTVQYELRSAKQVERRMLIDALQTLSGEGWDISNYQYTGMGSVYFVDFVLLHKFLGINDMWSVEFDEDITKRVKFNRPFSFIKLFMDDVGDVIPQLSPRKRHILWIDYDTIVSGKVVQDVMLAAGRLSRGSILLVTVDVEPPVRDGGPRKWKEYFNSEVKQYLRPNSRFGRDNIVRVNLDVLANAISAATAGRLGLEFLPLFSFDYRDGHRMLTMGGMFIDPNERAKMMAGRLAERGYIRFSFEDDPYRINVPRVTRKERLYLEGAMPCRDGWVPTSFEMEAEDVRSYSEIYRFFPVYAELFL